MPVIIGRPYTHATEPPMSTGKIRQLIASPEFWIGLFFLLRLVGITHPPLEIAHNWRQVTGLMVARNFLETDPTFWYPRINDHQGLSGIIGMEFPLLNYLHYLLAEAFGYTHWYGRLINLVLSSIGVFCFGRLVERYFNRKMALSAVVILLASAWFSFSRKMMPDTFCVALTFVGLFFGSQYAEHGKTKHVIGFILLLTLGMLSKISAGIYLVILPLWLFYYHFSKRTKLMVVYAAIPLMATAFWYFIWNPHLSETYGIWYNAGQSVSTGLNELATHWPSVLERFYFSAFFGFIFFVMAIAGLLLAIVSRNSMLLWITGSTAVVFAAYMIRSGFYFHHHDYYIIPFVPIMALLAAYAVSRIRQQWAFVLILVIGVVEGVANQQHDFFIKDSEKYKLQLESIADQVSLPSDLIVINGNGNPQQLYLSHRKGWNVDDNTIADLDFLERVASQGARYVFVNKRGVSQPLPLPVVLETNNYVVYSL